MSNSVPEGWTSSLLAEFCDVVGGGTPDRSVREFWGGDIPWASPTEITSSFRKYISETKERITDKGLEKSSAKLHPPGTVLMTSRASIGFVAINTVPMATNQGFQSLRCKDGALADYLYQYITWLRPELEKMSAGSTFSEISSSSVKKLRVTLPPLPEQQKIAAILSSVDDVIEKTRAQIDKLKDLKTGVMQELLTKGIGPDGAPHTAFKDSPVGRIPEEWAVCMASEVAEEVMVGVVIKPTQYYVDSGIPALRSANVRENGLTMENLKYFSIESNEKLKKSKLRKGDLLTVRTGYPGTTAVVTDGFEGCNCIDVVITRPSERMNSNFFSMWVNSDGGKGQVLKAQGGLAQQHFNVGDMKNLLIVVPPLEEQKSIFGVVDSVAKKISTAEARLDQVGKVKKALMQDLLTGKVRVNVS
ncbi:restriction endonuclease subunit S [Spongiibacter tropicus]|uniref:restriction endonuclease subunit S n=1 Tax=Spongiibacter tropicus TaxID=454602 RepID=UPI0023572CD5|nr:restriction endonuclease subunit S [Spongiibacter tropicus]|tara:strand:+ start:1030 stop:2280 length:1251 start_codon:yes stop_codon:yes gene_type:complete